MKRIKKLSLIVCSIVCLLAVGIIGYTADNDKNDSEETVEKTQGETIVVEDENITLSYDEEAKSLQITDQTGYTWNSVVNEELYSSENLNENWQKNTKSIFYISYAEISDVNPTIKTAFSYNAEIDASKKEEKIYLDCKFKKEGISLTVILGVENGEMVVSVPGESIQEKKDNRVLSIEMLPYFGACTDTEEGYMVYPDGSGALKYHNSIKSETTTNHSYTWDVYGNDILSTDTPKNNEKDGLMTAMFPVFGVKKGEHAFIAYSDKGEEESSINMYPSGVGIALNRMSFSFRYRTTYSILMSNININGTNTAQNINGLMYNEEIISADHELRYSFLNEVESDYSGMAGRYRECLLASGDLQTSELKEKMGVSVQVLMAASAQGFFNDTVSVATTAEQVEEIIDAVNDIGFESNALFTLKGWEKGGYGVCPQSSKPDGKVASASEFQELLDSDEFVSLQAELFYADEDNGGFDKRSDLIKAGNQNVITDGAGKLFLFNAENVNENYKALDKVYSSADTLNISFNTVGKVLYRDENEKQVYHRGDMKDALETMLEKASGRGLVSVEGANLYALKYADSIYNLPAKSSEYFISDMDIPFVQMVLYGTIPYTGDLGNLSSDYSRQLLKWLEYGYIPAFELTYSDSEVLKETNYSDLYSSQYESNTERLEQALKLYEECISKVKDAYMVKHTVLGKDFVKVEYSNGCAFYVNYATQEKTYEDVTVGAKGYVMVGE